MTDLSGLQPERTTLAYRRTELALAVVALLIGREALVRADRPAVAAIAFAGAALAVIFTARRQRALHHGDTRPAPVTIYATGASVGLLQIAALLVI